MKAILNRGSKWTLDTLEEDRRKQDLEDALTFGNHKGAQKNPIQLRTLVEKDVTHGYDYPSHFTKSERSRASQSPL